MDSRKEPPLTEAKPVRKKCIGQEEKDRRRTAVSFCLASLDEECLGTGIYKLHAGDHVGVTCRAACSRIHVRDERSSGFDTSSLFSLVGTVERDTLTGDVPVTFGNGIRCTVEPAALVKIPKLYRGDIVKLVDDIRGDGNLKLGNADFYKPETRCSPRFCILLEDSDHSPDSITVDWGNNSKAFSRFHLDFVAGRVKNDFREVLAKLAFRASSESVKVEFPFKILQDSMQHLPDVDMLYLGSPSPCAPGAKFKASDELVEFVRWYVHAFRERNRHYLQYQDEDTPHEVVLNVKYTTPDLGQLSAVLGRGKVVQVNCDGDAIVQLCDHTVWCLRSTVMDAVSFDRTLSRFDSSGETFLQYHFQGLKLEKRHKETRSGLNNMEELDRLIKYILENVESFPELREACLHAACFSGNRSLLHSMLESQFNLDGQDNHGNTALHYAAHGNQPEIIQDLLPLMKDKKPTSERHCAALQFAVKEGFVDCVRALKRSYDDFNANIKDEDGNTILHISLAQMDIQTTEELVHLPTLDFGISNKYGLNCLHVAALKGNASATQRILSRRPDLCDIRHHYQGYAAIHFAAIRGHSDVIKELLKKPSCSVDLENNREETALLLAAREGYGTIVEMLLLGGASINKADQHGNTALHHSLTGKQTVIKPLDAPSSHAMISTENKIRQNGQADVEGRLLLACFLVRSGAGIRCSNKDGKTPLDIAFSMQGPAVELLAVSAHQRSTADSKNCKFCLEEAATTTFSPCGHCFYCHICGNCLKHCPDCGEFIKARDLQPPTREEPPASTKSVAAKLGSKIYRMVEKPRGLCLIIDNSTSDCAKMMSSLFTELHFKVTLKRKLTAGDMLLELVRASYAEELQWGDCLVVIILSPGSETTIRGTDKKELFLHRHVYPLFNDANCPDFQGKPKLFFIQTCETGQSSDTLEEYSTSSWSDMFCAHAIIRRFKQLTDTETTESFFHVVDSIFRQYAGIADLDELMKFVTNWIERHPEPKLHQRLKIQPYGWKKSLYFNPGVLLLQAPSKTHAQE